jgi:hypothetical protein
MYHSYIAISIIPSLTRNLSGGTWSSSSSAHLSTSIDEWSATQGPVLWPLLNVVTGRLMFHGHRWMKCYPVTSPMTTTECCDWKTDIISSSAHLSTSIDEWSATQWPALWPLLNVATGRLIFHGHGLMKCYPLTECCDLKMECSIAFQISWEHPERLGWCQTANPGRSTPGRAFQYSSLGQSGQRRAKTRWHSLGFSVSAPLGLCRGIQFPWSV